MAIRIRATCSECYHQQELDLASDQEEIRCPECGHSVPMFGDDDFDEIETEQKKRNVHGYIAMGALVVMFVAFLWFISSMGAETVPPEVLAVEMGFKVSSEEMAGGEEAGAGRILSIVLMGVSGLSLLVFGCKASARKFICEY